jgi:hypothetical protein
MEEVVKLSKNLSDFNRSMANRLANIFASNVEPYQMVNGTLVFRGPIEGHTSPDHIGTHVAVSLDPEVHSVIAKASLPHREEMTRLLLDNLGTQVKCQYDPKSIGPYALDIIGTKHTIGPMYLA